MGNKIRQSGRIGRLAVVSALVILGGLVLIQSLRTVWNVQASAELDQSAYAPVVLGNEEGPTATATLFATATPPPNGTETPTVTATATEKPTKTPKPTRTPNPTKTPKGTSTPGPTNTPVPTDEPEDTPTPTQAPPGDELLVYDLNREVVMADRGFPYGDAAITEAGNIDWTSPTDFAGGTLHFRVEIFDQPKPMDMKLGLCFWQDGTTLENCGPNQILTGEPGTVATWSVQVSRMYKKDGLPIDWSLPRSRVRGVIKNMDGVPVSDIGDWNWGGDDPNDWYPLDMRLTAVVVEKGASFSGWGNYP